jgi:hypothetical protein
LGYCLFKRFTLDGINRGWVGFNPSIEMLLMQTSHLVFVVVAPSPKFQSFDWEIILSGDKGV